jgi:hypothetical protein
MAGFSALMNGSFARELPFFNDFRIGERSPNSAIIGSKDV